MTTPAPRFERRFEPTSATPAGVLFLVLNAGALAAGAGAVGLYVRASRPDAAPLTTELLAVGALLLAAATLLTSGGGVRVRVGPSGVALEKGDLVRIPWHAIEALRHEGSRVILEGTSEFGVGVREALPLRTHRTAITALVAEAKRRVPACVPESLASIFDGVPPAAGEEVALEPVQLAGKRCAASGQPIAFDSDGLACPNCGRVYAKAAAPEACPCGADLR